MGQLDRELEIVTGRRMGDGRVRLSVFAHDLLALTVEGRGERAPVVLLTREQARELREALGELIPVLRESAATATDERAGATWQGGERRQRAG
jgi:hypothetical protein